jgi:mRNA interferase MazF
MERLPKPGEVVFLPFPFSDLSASKHRPALILQTTNRNDMITVQISSKDYADPRALKLTRDDFTQGGLPLVSYVQTGKLFTANAALMTSAAGTVRDEVLNKVIDRVCALLRGGAA